MKRRLVFTANDRHDYFRATMAAWQQVRGFTDWAPVVYLEPGRRSERMSEIAQAAGATVSLNPQRRGVLSNPWHALDTAFADADFVVLAEDDVLVSDDTLEFFTWAAQEFRDERVLGVCANTQAATCPPGAEQVVELNQRLCPLVWGTWADRWRDVLRDTWDHDYSSGTPTQPQSGWDWHINLRLLAGWRTATPLASRSDHIGQYGGTHMRPADFPASVSPTFLAHREPAPFIRQPVGVG